MVAVAYVHRPQLTNKTVTQVLFYILACFNCIVVYQGPFYVLLILVGMCSVFWLF